MIGEWSSKCESCSDCSVAVAVIFDPLCLLASFEVVCKVQVAIDIGSEVLVLSLCTSFQMSVVVGSLCCK